jgi:hypothetical protein
MPNLNNMCPVCLFPSLDEPSHDSDGFGSFEICKSCGTQFGYDDANTSWLELRKRWIDAGLKWWCEAAGNPRPANWNPEKEDYDSLKTAPKNSPL